MAQGSQNAPGPQLSHDSATQLSTHCPVANRHTPSGQSAWLAHAVGPVGVDVAVLLLVPLVVVEEVLPPPDPPGACPSTTAVPPQPTRSIETTAQSTQPYERARSMRPTLSLRLRLAKQGA